MRRIALIGPESTGKTTLAQRLAGLWHMEYIPELARDYVGQLHRPYTEADVLDIARQQVEQLRTLPDGNYIFDTELILTRVWLDEVYHRVPEWLCRAIHDYPMDFYLLCYPDLPWQPDPVRENGTDKARLALYHRYKSELEALGRPYYIVRWSTDSRPIVDR